MNVEQTEAMSEAPPLSKLSFTVEAPGRLCLFGEHQDYLHLPVIAAALPREHVCRIVVQSQRNPATEPKHRACVLTLRVPALHQVRRYDLANLPPRKSTVTASLVLQQQQDNHPPLATDEPDFALAALYEALDDGWTFPNNHNTDCLSTSSIPLQAGCSSSSAFCVAWSGVLARLAGQDSDAMWQQPVVLAQRAHRAEVTHWGAPGGTMDHVTSAVGGLLRIGGGSDSDTVDPWQYESLSWQASHTPNDCDVDDGANNNNCCWVLAYSGEPKDTFKHLHRCKQARLALLHDKLQGSWDTDTTNIDLSADEEQLLWATLVNRDTERQAAQAFIQGKTSGEYLGRLLHEHHAALRDGLHLSTPALERLNEAAMQAGAYGFKVVGSGGGGCGVAWTLRQTAAAVAKAMEQAGAPQVWILDAPGSGARLISEE